MDKFGYTKDYLTINDKPWFAIMGEMHYSRFDSKLWKQSLDRIKSGGIDIVSSYVIWIHHEEVEGEYNFSGNCDLRKFVETAGECGLKLFLRIGPWVHAEVRNGGFPDWLLKKDFEPRTNDEKYFQCVEKFYAKIFEQVKGLLHKDGGSIIGVQIENEYGHCGGLEGDEGNRHIHRLTEIARKVGFDVPYFTATGWGGAMIDELIPVMGAYCDAPWDPRVERLEPNPNYLFSYERNDKNIGSDRRLGFGLTFDQSKYPWLMSELGSALNSTYHRRLEIKSEDIGAMALCKLGSGCNLLGYYMYHGGTNPVGKLSTFEENKATGSINDMPIYNYDGRAPLRQYGQFGDTYRELKLIHMFIKDFGTELAKMPAHIPESNPKRADDLENYRLSVRYNFNGGYLFINNFQRMYEMAEHLDETVSFDANGRTVSFEHMDIKDKMYGFFPFDMAVGKAILKTANATPLCKINGDYVFYTDGNPRYCFEGEPETEIITLTKEQALHSYKYVGDKDYLLISEGDFYETEKGLCLCGGGECSFKIYPQPKKTPNGFVKSHEDGIFTVYTLQRAKTADVKLDVKETPQGCTVDLSYSNLDCDDIILDIEYGAEKMDILIDGKIVNDDYCAGDGVQFSLGYFGYPQQLEIKLVPHDENDGSVYFEHPPAYKNGKAQSIYSISSSIIYVYNAVM